MIEYVQLVNGGIPVAWAGPVSLSAAITEIGAPLDWWHAGIAGSLNPGVSKLTGGNQLTLAVIGADAGADYNPAETFSWTDGPTGAGSSNHAHVSNVQTPGNGYRITTPAPTWPDWREIIVWDNVASIRDTGIIASINDPAVVTQQEFVTSSYNDSRAPVQNERFRTVLNGLFRVRFCSPTPGKTFTLDLIRSLNTSMGSLNLYAVALYRGAATKFPPQGIKRIAMLEGAISPLGGR